MSALAVRTGSVNLGQGFPDQDGPPEVIAAAVRRCEHGANQYAPGPGRPELRQAIARHQQRHYGLELDPDRQVVVTTGCTEAIAAALLGLVEPGRRGGRAGAVLRLLRRDDPDGRRRTPSGDAAGAGLPARRRRAAGRGDAEDPVRAAQQPAQPDRHGAQPRGAAGGRRRRDRARPRGDHRRGLRAPDLRRHRARADRDAARDVRADADPVERRQVLLVHRLEGRLGDRSGRARRRGAGRQAVAHLHLRVTAPAGRRRWPSTRSRTSRARWPATSRSGATCCSTGSARPG